MRRSEDFMQKFTVLRNRPTALPFVAGGLTQQGRTGHGSQDALAAASGKNYIAGIVCDGCAGTIGIAGQSMNEVGAHVTADIMINALCLSIRKADTPDDMLLIADRYLGSGLRGILKLLLPQTPSQNEEEHIAFNLLAATIAGFVITPEFWTVFHYGDGICGVNGHIDALEDSSGKYYIARNMRWRTRRKHAFSVYAQGETKNLHSLIIGSDGMMDMLDGQELADFMRLSEDWEYERGICDTMEFTREFRERVSGPFSERSDMTEWDDRTAIIVRRLEA